MLKDNSKIKGVYVDDRMEGRGEMITKDNKVFKQIWTYGVVNEDLTNKKFGCIDRFAAGVNYYSTLVINKL